MLDEGEQKEIQVILSKSDKSPCGTKQSQQKRPEHQHRLLTTASLAGSKRELETVQTLCYPLLMRALLLKGGRRFFLHEVNTSYKSRDKVKKKHDLGTHENMLS